MAIVNADASGKLGICTSRLVVHAKEPYFGPFVESNRSCALHPLCLSQKNTYDFFSGPERCVYFMYSYALVVETCCIFSTLPQHVEDGQDTQRQRRRGQYEKYLII